MQLQEGSSGSFTSIRNCQREIRCIQCLRTRAECSHQVVCDDHTYIEHKLPTLQLHRYIAGKDPVCMMMLNYLMIMCKFGCIVWEQTHLRPSGSIHGIFCYVSQQLADWVKYKLRTLTSIRSWFQNWFFECVCMSSSSTNYEFEPRLDLCPARAHLPARNETVWWTKSGLVPKTGNDQWNWVLNTFTSFDAPSRDMCGWSMYCACVV